MVGFGTAVISSAYFSWVASPQKREFHRHAHSNRPSSPHLKNRNSGAKNHESAPPKRSRKHKAFFKKHAKNGRVCSSTNRLSGVGHLHDPSDAVQKGWTIQKVTITPSRPGNSSNLKGPFGELEKTQQKYRSRLGSTLCRSPKRYVYHEKTYSARFVFAMLHCFDAVGTWPPRSIDRIGRPNDGYTSRKVLHACAEPVSKPPVLERGKVKVSGNPQGVWLFLVSSKTGWKKS